MKITLEYYIPFWFGTKKNSNKKKKNDKKVRWKRIKKKCDSEPNKQLSLPSLSISSWTKGEKKDQLW